jgi:hypothetical protein
MKKIATTLAILAATVALAAPASAEVYPPQWKCGVNEAGNSANCLPTVWVKARNEINARTVAKAARPALLAYLDELSRWIEDRRPAPPMA